MDRRQQKSRKAIIDAFISLLSEKSYSQISVQEIIDLANVGRTTFYAHFETRDYLLKELCEGLFEHIIDFTTGHHGACGHSDDCCLCKHREGKEMQRESCPFYQNCEPTSSVFLHLLNHIKNNDNHLLDLLSSKNDELFRRYFKENLKNLVECRYSEALSKSILPKDYLVNHISASFVESVDWWLKGKKKETANDVINYFLGSIEPLLK